MGKEIFNKKFLVPIFFIGFPFLAGVVISYCFEYLIDFKKVMVFVTFSSWFFSFFSILLIFIVWEKFRDSILRKNIRDKKYLDKEAIEDLKLAVQIVRLVADGKKDIDQLSENCRAIKYIYNKLKNQKQDTELYSLKYEVDDVFSIVNKFNLESIGRNMDSKEWGRINEEDKEVIAKKTYTLERELESLLKEVG